MKPSSTLGAGDVGTNELGNNSVTGSKITDGTINDGDTLNVRHTSSSEKNTTTTTTVTIGTVSGTFTSQTYRIGFGIGFEIEKDLSIIP